MPLRKRSPRKPPKLPKYLCPKHPEFPEEQKPVKHEEPQKPKRIENWVYRSLNKIIQALSIKEWDFLIVGDGSGSGWNGEAGWGCISIERATGEVMTWSGAVNRGTVNLAELMAYVQPLNWLASREIDRRSQNFKTRAYQVHIVTDSEYCRRTGKYGCNVVSKNSALWTLLAGYKQLGLVLNWHWMRRSTSLLNKRSDELSKQARLLFKHHGMSARMKLKGPKR